MIGVTGGIACGKSTVMRELADLGATVIDADIVYHDLIVPETPLWHALVDRFGEEIVGDDDRIDRAALGAIVFADPSALADLDRMTHPAVTSELERRIASAITPVVAVDAVKLVESGFDAACDRVWVVTCERAQQIDRLMARSGLTRSAAERRVDAQAPVEPLLHRADLVLDNSKQPDDTRAAVRAAWSTLEPPARDRHRACET